MIFWAASVAALAPPLRAIERWHNELVVGYELCPWAAGAARRVVVLDNDDEDRTFTAVAREAEALAANRRPWATTFCVLPQFSDLPLFQRLSKRCERRLPLEVLAFHPKRRDRRGPECVQFAMRAPVPVIQLLRASDLEVARNSRGDTPEDVRAAMLAILKRNEDTLTNLGLPRLTAMFQSWLDD